MSIIKCPECSGTVSTQAVACPHCGAPVQSERTVVTGAQFADSLSQCPSDSASATITSDIVSASSPQPGSVINVATLVVHVVTQEILAAEANIKSIINKPSHWLTSILHDEWKMYVALPAWLFVFWFGVRKICPGVVTTSETINFILFGASILLPFVLLVQLDFGRKRANFVSVVQAVEAVVSKLNNRFPPETDHHAAMVLYMDKQGPSSDSPLEHRLVIHGICYLLLGRAKHASFKYYEGKYIDDLRMVDGRWVWNETLEDELRRRTCSL